MSEARIAQMLDSQLAGENPFQRAQDIATNANMAMPEASIMQGTPFDFKPMQASEVPVQATPATNLLAPAKMGDKSNFDKSGISAMLQKLNINDKNLALNDIGRVQLVGRLKDKYGANFNQNPEALDVLKKFDAAINKFQDEKQTSTNALIAQGERTLAELLRGK